LDLDLNPNNGAKMKKDLDSYILTRQELLIMKVIWERGSASVREVCDVIAKKKPTAYTTVLTLMQILEKKGALTRKRKGRSYLYSPIFTESQATRNQVHDLLHRFFDGDPDKLIETIREAGFRNAVPVCVTVDL
jgi:predicted transcriptional regulator